MWEFFPDDIQENLAMLDRSICLLEVFRCSNMHSELLLYKARYLIDANRLQEAVCCFNADYYSYIMRHSEEAVSR